MATVFAPLFMPSPLQRCPAAVDSPSTAGGRAREAGHPGKSGPMKMSARLARTVGILLIVAVAGGVFGLTYWQQNQSSSLPPESEPASRVNAYFRDVTPGSGVDFTHRNGEEADYCTILESLGGGVALFDY